MPSAARLVHRAALVAALAAAPLATRGAPDVAGVRRTFPVAEAGALSVEVPRGWRVRSATLGPGAPPSIRLDAPGGGALFLAPAPDPEGEGLDAARLYADLARHEAIASAGGEPDLETLTGPDGAALGYLFSATDRGYRRPAKGEERWRNLVRGAVVAGRLVVKFTWFDDAPGPGRARALAIVRGARHEPEAAAPAPAPPEGEGKFELTPDPRASTVPLAVQEPGGAFTVLVDLPGFKLYAPRASPDGAGTLVLGEDPGSGIVASVTIGPADGAADARACREAKLARLRKAAPDLGEVRTAEAGETARLSYALRELRGREVRQEHAHTFLLRAGRCVDVHASKADPAPGDGATLQKILATARFATTL